MRIIKNLWSWSGETKNHNNLLIILTILAILLGYNKVNSLQDSIEGLYGEYVREVFCDELVEYFYIDENGYNIVSIELKNRPIENSINIWEAGLNVSPNFYTIKNNTIELRTAFDSKSLKNQCGEPWLNYVVTYIPKNN